MSAISSLPVEIWESILRRAIVVPDFLDPDPEEDALVETLYKNVYFPMADESDYWRTERVRNCLQRVSKSWDAYLRRFEHRYVRLLDIRSGRVAPNMLKKAIRISLGGCNRFCTCHVPPFRDGRQGSLGDFCQQTLQEIDSLDAEIVDMQCEPRSILPPESYPKFVHVKTLFARGCIHDFPLVQLIGALPNLRRAYTKTRYVGRIGGTITQHLSSQTLQTLTIQISRNGNDNITMELPSLQHLLIKCHNPNPALVFWKASIVIILGEIGGQLRSLHLHYVPGANERLDELWELCPKLEVLYIMSSLPSSPPPFHPIHTLVVHHVKQLQLLRPLPEWPNLRRVVFLHPGGFADQEELRTLAVASRARGCMRLEDANGLTLEDYRP